MSESGNGLGLLERYQPLVLIAAMLLGFVVGEFFHGSDRTGDMVIYLGLVILMYGIALGTPLRSVASSYRNRRFFAIALADNFIIVPVIGYGLALIFLDASPMVFVGFILYIINPCTDWFLTFTGMAKGDVSLGLALLPINLMLQILLMPFYLLLFVGQTLPFQLTTFIETAVVFILLPFALAGLTNRIAAVSMGPELRRSLANVPMAIQTASLTVIIFFMFADQTHVIMDNIGPLSLVLVPVAIFFVLSYFIAKGISSILRLKYGKMALLSCTTIARNSPLALAISFGLFPDQPLVQVAIIIGVLIEMPALVIIVRTLNIRRNVCAGRTDAG